MKTIKVLSLCGLMMLASFSFASCSNNGNQSKVQLDTPTITKTGDNTISWTEIANASSYCLSINGIETRATTTSYIFNEYGTYLTKVMALSESGSNYLNSEWSCIVTITYSAPITPSSSEKEALPSPTVDKLDYKTVWWLPVVGASSYEVYVNGQKVTTTEDTQYSLGDNTYGDFEVYVIALSDSSEVNNSVASNKINLEILDPSSYSNTVKINIDGLSNVIVGNDATYSASVVSKTGTDSSYLPQEVVYSVSEGATISSDGVFHANATGTYTLTVKMATDDSVVATKQIKVIETPTVSLNITEYKKNEINTCGVEAGFSGKIYYLNSAEPLSKEDLMDKGFSTEVKDTDTTISLDLGKVKGASMDIYYVEEFLEGDKVVGYSSVNKASVTMELAITEVSNSLELYNALMANEEYIKLTDDINCGGAWTQVTTVFTGTLDGNGHKVSNVELTGSNTGLIATIGDLAEIKNITFDSIKATGFDGAENAIFAHTVEKGARVVFDNVAFTNTVTTCKIEGSSRSTAGLFFATYGNAKDASLDITIKNCYVDWEFDTPRATCTYNIGTIFGTYYSAGNLKVENCMFDIVATGNYGNIGTLIGQGCGNISISNVAIRTNCIPGNAPASDLSIDVGSKRTEVTDNIQLNNVVTVSSTTTASKWGQAAYEALSKVEDEKLQALGNAFTIDGKKVSLNVNGTVFTLKDEELATLASPVLVNTDGVVTWENVAGATGYKAYVDGVEYSFDENTIDLSEADYKTYEVKVIALGDNFQYADSNEAVIAVEIKAPELPLLDSPTLTVDGFTVTINNVENAIGYQMYVDGEKVEMTNNSYTFASDDYAEHKIYAIALGDKTSYLNSKNSATAICQVKYEVSTLQGLRDAIEAGIQFISITDDIDMTSWDCVASKEFVGVIDGNGHTLANLTLVNGSTAFLYQLGNCAVRNINFTNVSITAGGSNMAALATTVSEGAQIELTNLVFDIDAKTNETNSSSTQGGIIANYKNGADTKLHVTLTNVAVNYTMEVTRSKAQSNVGAVFGTLNVGGKEAITIVDCYFNVKFIGYNSNAGVIIGNGYGPCNIQNTIIIVEKESFILDGTEYKTSAYFDFGNNQAATKYNNLIFIGEDISDRTGAGTATVNDVAKITKVGLTSEIMNAFAKVDSSWKVDGDSLVLTINGQAIKVTKIEQATLSTPVVAQQDGVISWNEVEGALSYDIYLNDTKQANVTTLTYDLNPLANGEYAVKVVAVGDGLYYANSEASEVINVTIVTVAVDLDKAILSENEKIISWTAIENATSYEVFINDESKGEQQGTTYSLIGLPTGEYAIKVVAKNGTKFFNDSTSDVLSVSVVNNTTPLENPVVTISGLEVSVEASANASEIELYIDGEKATLTEGKYTFDEANYGIHEIKAIAKGDNVTYADSEYVTKEITIKLSVTTMAALNEALTSNIAYISIENDLSLEGWSQVATVFSGILDGNGHTLTGYSDTTASGGIFKQLGSATIKNLTIKDAVITDGSATKSECVLATGIARGSKVVIENFALVNCVATTSTEGGSSSTQGGLFAAYSDSSDKELKITLKNCYIEYTHNVTRTGKSQSNVGGIFGTFYAGSEEALVIENSFIKVSVSGYLSNAGAFAGNSSSNTKVVNSMVEFITSDINASSAKIKLDYGNAKSEMTTTLVTSIIYNNETYAMQANVDTDEASKVVTSLSSEDINCLINDASAWKIVDEKITLSVNGVDYSI